jgi:hypothetical protein
MIAATRTNATVNGATKSDATTVIVSSETNVDKLIAAGVLDSSVSDVHRKVINRLSAAEVRALAKTGKRLGESRSKAGWGAVF